MLFVVLTGLTLIFMITTAWYVSQAMVVAISAAVLSVVTEGSGLSVLHLAQFVSIVWGPVFDLIVVAWMITSAQARDVESEIYR